MNRRPMNNETLAKVVKDLEESKDFNRSAWKRGVNKYAFDLLEELDERIECGYFDADDLNAPKLVKKSLLNGADDWNQYSYGGCSLIYDYDIADRLCTDSELKRTRNGERRPNANETWLDTQARALFQASRRIMNTLAKVLKEEEN